MSMVAGPRAGSPLRTITDPPETSGSQNTSNLAEPLHAVQSVVVERRRLLATHHVDASGTRCAACGHVYGASEVLCPAAVEAAAACVSARLVGDDATWLPEWLAGGGSR